MAGLGLPAQSWGTPFDHETINSGPVPNPNATDHLTPFGGYTNANISYYQYAPGVVLDWPQRMNAVHMCLIPKGPHQGKVLVWGATQALLVGAPVLIRAPGFGPTLLANEFHACAAWSIVDPAVAPTGPRFRNYLLPLEVFTAPAPTAPSYRAGSLFCAGQAWSPYGDLIVAGGTKFGVPTLQGPRYTFAFNPKSITRGWPSSPTIPLYPGQVGLWEPGPDLIFDRFYPTTTQTSRLNRLAAGGQPTREVVVVSGGSVDDASDDPAVNVTWNNYEALVVSNEAMVLNSGLARDTVAGQSWWPGPGSGGSPPPVEEDWLEDYPRMHLLSTGELLFSGYAPRWAKVNHDLAPGVWSRQAAPPYSSTTWQFPRHDGTSVLFPNVGGLKDMVVRMGGADEVNYAPAPNGTTSTVEAWFKSGTGGFWASAGNLPNPQPGTLPDGRYLMNVVILPDASLLVLGGTARQPYPGFPAPVPPNVPVREPLLYKNGAWSVLPPNPTVSVRDYHSSAVLLPDGRVFCGGGNGRNFDYEVFSPAYMALPKPQNVAISAPFDFGMDAFRMDYGVKYTVSVDPLPLGEYVSKIVLMAPGAATHHSDMHMRYFELPWTQMTDATTPTVEVTAPPGDKHAPRGNYMLFVVTSAGAVADAIWVVLR